MKKQNQNQKNTLDRNLLEVQILSHLENESERSEGKDFNENISEIISDRNQELFYFEEEKISE